MIELKKQEVAATFPEQGPSSQENSRTGQEKGAMELCAMIRLMTVMSFVVELALLVSFASEGFSAVRIFFNFVAVSTKYMST